MKKAMFALLVVTVASGAFGDGGGLGKIRLKGYLGERLDAMIGRHVAGTDVDYITAPFLEKTETKGCWQTEFWGKWMHSAVPYAAYADSEKLRAKVEVEKGDRALNAAKRLCDYVIGEIGA